MLGAWVSAVALWTQGELSVSPGSSMGLGCSVDAPLVYFPALELAHLVKREETVTVQELAVGLELFPTLLSTNFTDTQVTEAQLFSPASFLLPQQGFRRDLFNS